MSKFNPYKLKLSEHFYSIQGEGKSTGVPSYFVRLTYCNLTCGASSKLVNKIIKGDLEVDPNANWHGDLHLEGKATWTCDTIPVWTKGEDQDFQYLINSWKDQGLYEDIKSGLCHVIWTGGEPTMPQHQESIINFTNYLNEYDFKNEHTGVNSFYEIETNGTFYIEDKLFNALAQINCSPKLSNSGMNEKQRIVPKAIKRIKSHSNYQFKFVISHEEDVQEIFRDFIIPFIIPLTNVCCMPGLDDQANYHERTNFICEMAKKYKFIASQRMHISSWGAVTGV